jgi:hypothetical protein
MVMRISDLIGTGLLVMALLLLATYVGIVDFTYISWIENHPLKNPVRITNVDRGLLDLEDGRQIWISASSDLLPTLREAGFEVELQEVENDVMLWGKEKQSIGVCGYASAWIHLPIIPIKTNRYRRIGIGWGEFLEPVFPK